MTEEFAIRIFYADGNLPEIGKRRICDLSPRWLSICEELLSSKGPVFKYNMGSKLAHFDISFAGPMIELIAYGLTCFHCVISLGTGSQQDQAVVLKFQEMWSSLVKNADNKVDPIAFCTIEQAAKYKCILILDVCPTLDDDQKIALLELGEHLAAAYIKYCDSSVQ